MKQIIILFAMIVLGVFIAGLIFSYKPVLETKNTQTKNEITNLTMSAITIEYPERIG